MSKGKRRFAWVALGALFLGGCELIVDFDRSKIDSGVLDGSFADSPGDVNQPDVKDATTNDVADTGADVTTEAGADASDGSTADATADAGPDAADAAAEAEAGTAQLVISPTQNPYGNVATGTSTSDVTFTVTNNGTATSGVPAVGISGTDANQFAISTNNCTAALAPNGTCTILVKFSPTTTGAKSASLDVSATPGGNPSAALTGTGITATLTIAPTSNNYGTVVVNTSTSDVTFTVTNTGGLASGVPNVALSGNDPGEFTISTNNCTAALAPNGTCTVLVKFSPTSSTLGAKSASLDVSATPGGMASATLSGTSAAQASLAITPSPKDFGTVPQNTSSTPVTFTVTNNGGVASGTITMSVSGTNGTDFVMSNDTCSTTTLAAGGTCTVDVTFTPTTATMESATLTATATPGGPATSNLTGTGQ